MKKMQLTALAMVIALLANTVSASAQAFTEFENMGALQLQQNSKQAQQDNAQAVPQIQHVQAVQDVKTLPPVDTFTTLGAPSRGGGGGGGGGFHPSPSPAPRPEPAPRPMPQPRPEPAPRPQPAPRPEPAPRPNPTPAPRPNPTPAPRPNPTPAPRPNPTPAPRPNPTPNPRPNPTPNPRPNPTPNPRPNPTPNPRPNPTPNPRPGPRPTPPVITHPGNGGLPKPQPIKDPGKVIDPRHNAPGQIDPPKNGPDNRPLGQKPLQDGRGRQVAPGGNRLGGLRDKGVEGNVRDINGKWDNRNRGYDWHSFNGFNMVHHFDGRYHWWGFYLADVYFWSIYFNDYYWWYDPYWHRWCYMQDGSWWWQNPDNLGDTYIYQDGAYYQYNNSDGGVVLNPDPTPPVDVPPGDPTPTDPNAKTFYSDDGSRMVQITGDDLEAYLYDTANPPAFQPILLATGVSDVKFKLNGSQLAQILTLTSDGSFSTFDQNGNSLDGHAQAQTFSGKVAALGDGQDQQQGGPSSSVGQSLLHSAAFSALKAGSFGW